MNDIDKRFIERSNTECLIHDLAKYLSDRGQWDLIHFIDEIYNIENGIEPDELYESENDLDASTQWMKRVERIRESVREFYASPGYSGDLRGRRYSLTSGETSR